jgi:uncharacterized repeat protein (TIGR04076 family)
MGKMYKVKITVLQRELYPELAKDILSDPGSLRQCEMFMEGQEFIADGFLKCPDGMCAEAWQTLWPSALAISRGGTFAPYAKREHEWAVCCPDGLRPVTFKLERGDEMRF